MSEIALHVHHVLGFCATCEVSETAKPLAANGTHIFSRQRLSEGFF